MTKCKGHSNAEEMARCPTCQLDLDVSEAIARRLSEAGVLMENTAHPELAEALKIGANECERLIAEVKRLRPKPLETCPHATYPFRYCGDDGRGCRADPCPLGIGMKS